MTWDNVASTAVGGTISAVVAYLTLRGSLGNQLSLENSKFENQRLLDSERRHHDGVAFRRTLLRAFRRLDNTTRMDPESRISVLSWKNMTESVKNLLESEQCASSLDDGAYDAAWRAYEESESAIMFLEIWAGNPKHYGANFATLSIAEFCDALEVCLRTLGDAERAADVHTRAEAKFKGVRFWMARDFEETVCPNP